MTHPYILQALIHERASTFLAEAEAERQARQVRPRPRPTPCGFLPPWLVAARRPGRGRPAATSTQVVLPDGSQVLIRPVRSADAPVLADGFARLSDRSRRLRFLGRKDHLSEAELRYFTDVDHHDHEALGAIAHASGGGVGIARYIRDRDDPHAAEIAVTVVDDWQGRGLGSELLAQLAERACQEGIGRFTALVAADNTAMVRLLRNYGADLVRREAGGLEYEIVLACGPARPALACGPARAA